ncbi:uncharacterized protein [Parasteatoda tepidariorum]|uniref:uncharacterized protein n=1 Tax=Parasteatoda tepidariorum TaxID=114398 RepID=UPI0039BC8C7D
MEKSKVAVDESSTVDYRNETNSIVSLPPAYHKPPVSTSLKIARILSLTLLAMTAIIGILVIIGMYVHQGYQCQNYATQPMARIDRMDHEQQSSESSKQPVKDLPLKLELDAALGTILKNPKNKKAEVNCVAETKKASQIISQDPKMLMTPFGNFSTDPKLLRLTGERMVLSCISAIDKKPNKKKSANKGILSSFSFFIKSGILVLINQHRDLHRRRSKNYLLRTPGNTFGEELESSQVHCESSCDGSPTKSSSDAEHSEVQGSDIEYKSSDAGLPQPFSQVELNDLTRDLGLLKDAAE